MLHRTSRVSMTALVVAGLLAASAYVAPAAAQVEPEAARLQGVVFDEVTFQPVDSAVVKLVGSDLVVRVDRWGSFAFPDAPLGSVSLQVSAPGHPSIVQDVEVREDRIVFVQIALPSVAAVLDGLVVRGGQSRHQLEERAHTAIDLLELQVPRLRTASGVVGETDFALNLRSVNTINGSSAPLIVIDGVAMTRPEGAYEALLRIPASDVQEIELLKGPAAAFLYPYAANGVVRVTTKQGR